MKQICLRQVKHARSISEAGRSYLRARQLCPPSRLPCNRLVSIVREAQSAGEEAGVASQPPAASCTPARLSASGRRRRGECSGRRQGEEWVSQRERAGREGGRKEEHKSTCHNPSSQPALETEPNQQLARVMSERQQPVAVAEGRPAIRSAD